MIENLLSGALWLAGIGHFVVLIASSQVPKYFNWKEDTAKLMPFNRKLFWTYGIYVFTTIFAFGVITLVFHDEFLRGNPVAMAMSVWIALFWLGRILLDAFSFGHDSVWPKGWRFVLGHFCLTGLFLCLVVTYALVFAKPFFG